MEIPVYIFQTSNFIQKDKKKKDTHYNNYPTLHSVSKEPKSAIQKLSLTFCILYPLFLNNDNDGIIIFFFLCIPWLKILSQQLIYVTDWLLLFNTYGTEPFQ